ncbi:hypothetical protein OOS50_002637 [Escherichia coli O157]|nr:hypothetical protein [Escherichia coli O157]
MLTSQVNLAVTNYNTFIGLLDKLHKRIEWHLQYFDERQSQITGEPLSDKSIISLSYHRLLDELSQLRKEFIDLGVSTKIHTDEVTRDDLKVYFSRYCELKSSLRRIYRNCGVLAKSVTKTLLIAERGTTSWN